MSLRPKQASSEELISERFVHPPAQIAAALSQDELQLIQFLRSIRDVDICNRTTQDIITQLLFIR
jgi:hypothetical protein